MLATMNPGYSVKGLIETLEKSKKFAEQIVEAGYTHVEGNSSLFFFRKIINGANGNGHQEYFVVTVNTQMSGWVFADIKYYIKKPESTAYMTITENLSADPTDLAFKIVDAEMKLIRIGRTFLS